jgi:flagellar hook-basal body complex protein FliE
MQPLPVDPHSIGALSGSRPGQSGPAQSPAEAFKDLLARHLDEVNDLQLEADRAVRDLVTGRTDNLHGVIAALSEADLSFRLMMQVRNKLLEAYKEIMRMQV